MAVTESFQLALNLLRENRFAEMVQVCKEIVAVEPDHYRAFHGIGLGMHRLGQSDEGLYYIRTALVLNPEYFEAHLNLGNILRDLGRQDEALDCYRIAWKIRPDSPLVNFNLANCLCDLQSFAEANECYSRAIALDPSYRDPYLGRARLFMLTKDFASASADYRAILTLNPDHCEAQYNLGICLAELGCHEEAVSCFRNAITIDPDKKDAHLALGNYLSEKAEHGDPSGLDDAVTSYLKVLSLNPADGDTRTRLGLMLLVQGKIDEALNEFREAIQYCPEMITTHSCYLLSLQYHPAPTLRELFEVSISWWQRFAEKIPKITSHGNIPDPDRPLRIGYVSADFKRHPVGFHLMPVIYNHSAENYQVYCYSNYGTDDIYTDRLRSYADEWRNIVDMPDEAVQDMIIKDGIDILVDLSGHTGGNRLLLFARKPAPVQATWLGYFFSTGLREIDYIVMDDCAVLPGEDCWFSEKVIRLSKTRFCYEPIPYAPEVSSLPALKNGYITFGSFNNLAKVTSPVIQLWAKVLNAVPDSRLLLKSPAFQNSGSRERFIQQFADAGIAGDRLVLRGQSAHIDMLAEYGDMDIAVDPFPFNGGITSCEAMWMGVPVLTLTGSRPIARQTTGFLRTIGLTDFIASNEDEYCALACRWADNIRELDMIRSNLRKKMKDSLLCDGKTFSAHLESAYREMWRTWCKSR
jgi:protein O-GlcNAc transferase